MYDSAGGGARARRFLGDAAEAAGLADGSSALRRSRRRGPLHGLLRRAGGEAGVGATRDGSVLGSDSAGALKWKWNRICSVGWPPKFAKVLRLVDSLGSGFIGGVTRPGRCRSEPQADFIVGYTVAGNFTAGPNNPNNPMLPPTHPVGEAVPVCDSPST